MAAADEAEQVVVECLYAEADAVESRLFQLPGIGGVDVGGVGFDGDFGIVGYVVMFVYGVDDGIELCGGEL